MNTPGLFIVGAVVTLVVAAAIAVLIYGAILDGRDERRASQPEGGAPLRDPAAVRTDLAADGRRAA